MGADFLSKILEWKAEEVRQAEMRVPLSELRNRAEKRTDRRSFEKALAGNDGVRIIAEIKRGSPSRGLLRAELDPSSYARLYEQAGAAALSVLTDSRFFSGSMDDLSKARRACRLPVLRKDFLLCAYQIYEAAAAGADAVLLIVRTLSPEILAELFDICTGIGLDALVEIHGEEDLSSAAKAGARLIGINNRDLSSFHTDPDRAASMAKKLAPWQIPVAASGIRSRADIEKNLAAGIHCFLVGESLVTAEDPVRHLRHLQEVSP
jgi:indole-3-glycerol phosphate synthase